MPTLLSIDPGLAYIGFALFRPRELRHKDPIQQLGLAWEHTNPPTLHLAQRLANLAIWTRDAISQHQPQTVLIETPATSFDYGGQAGRRKNTNLLYEGLGAIQAGAAITLGPDQLHRLHYLKASTIKKKRRHKELHTRAAIHHVDLPTGPRGGALPNAWDAITTGILFLQQPESKG